MSSSSIFSSPILSLIKTSKDKNEGRDADHKVPEEISQLYSTIPQVETKLMAYHNGLVI